MSNVKNITSKILKDAEAGKEIGDINYVKCKKYNF